MLVMTVRIIALTDFNGLHNAVQSATISTRKKRRKTPVALPPGPLSNVSTEDIIAEIRRLRVTRVAAVSRASRPRGEKKAKNDEAFAALLKAAIEGATVVEPFTEEEEGP